ncbi:hypothetical protein KUTeg_000264 [Tegillarca granosa]|uniref:Uncharacterized protein n=1 Tax=Tegillarca granosa TaxID=220873 RepID=A0ABQ9G1E4_TEGGR|nr:hypothetical protein KUTeg_000264 [Tegillarca granosa]
MGPGVAHTPSNPISIRPVKEPGYMDMAPSSQPLPTVKEGGSKYSIIKLLSKKGGEAYLPMTPTGMSPVSATELKPAKVISYLSDDSMSGDIPPKRAYSVGSRPVSKTITHRHHHHNTETASKQNVSDNGRSSSAPHLIVQKIKRENQLLKNPLMQNPYMPMDGSHGYTNNYSPMSNYLNSDTDSFMEMDFYRPRTSSESFGSRPRSSSFNKVFAQGHRPRSSSYGQSSRGGKMGSFESVRTTSKDLLHRISHESVGRFSTPSSRTSSMESLRRIDNQSRCSNQSDYVEMHLDKKDNNSGYIDMTLPGGHSKSRSGASRSSSNQSLSSSPAVPGFTSPVSIDKHLSSSPDIKIVKASGHIVQKPTGFHPHSAADFTPSQSLFSPFNYTSSSGSRSPSVTGRSSAGSGRESEEESYVPFEPVVPSSKSSKISEKKESGKHKDKNKYSGSRRSSGSKEKSPKLVEKITKQKSAEEAESSYLEYEPADISSIMSKTIEYPPKHVDHSHDNKATEVVPSKSLGTVFGKAESSSNKNSDTKEKAPVDSLPDTGYMDYEPPKKEKVSLTNESTNERKASSEKTSLAKELTNERRFSNEGLTRNASSSKSVGSLRRSSSSNKSLEVDKPLPPDLERKESYKYMEFDPSTHQVKEDEEKSEVKSPTRVRSYIASNTSMESELSSTSKNFPTKPLPKFSTDEEDDLADKNTSSNKTSTSKDSCAFTNTKDSDKFTKNKNEQSNIDNGAKQKTKNRGHSGESVSTQGKVERNSSGVQHKTKNSNQSDSKQQKKKGKRNNYENVKVEKEEITMKMPMKPTFHLPSPEEDLEDDGYVGLDFTKEASERIDSNVKTAEPQVNKLGFVQVKKNIRKSDNPPPPFKLKALPVVDFTLKENKTITGAEGIINIDSKAGRKPLAPTKSRGNPSVVTAPAIRKRSVSSLDEMVLEDSAGRTETEAHRQESTKFPSKLIMPGPELHKQNSMPCMTLPVEQLPPKLQSANFCCH